MKPGNKVPEIRPWEKMKRIYCKFLNEEGFGCRDFDSTDGRCLAPYSLCAVSLGVDSHPIGHELAIELGDINEMLDRITPTEPMDEDEFDLGCSTCMDGYCPGTDVCRAATCPPTDEDLYPISDYMIGVPSENRTASQVGLIQVQDSGTSCPSTINIDMTVPEDPVDKYVIDHPSHYTEGPDSGIECWDWYELAMKADEFRGAMKNNVWKYTYRAGKKDDKVKDLRKAIAYLERWIKFEEGQRTVWMKGDKASE